MLVQYNIKIDAFEGPLDLLLHLIHRYEIDIYDIPVAVITEQYVNYIHTMKELQLDVASEYLVMAATLLAIKSKMLLPKHEEEWIEEELLEDPRQELMERLLAYQSYKQAAVQLREKEQERAQLFTREPVDFTDYQKQEQGEYIPVDVTLYDMLAAFQKLLRRKKVQKPLMTKIVRQEISIEKRMEEIMQQLEKGTSKKRFDELFETDAREILVTSFLAILELMKKKMIIIEQEHNFEDIYIMKSQYA
jgi:segregation and condensation protein A